MGFLDGEVIVAGVGIWDGIVVGLFGGVTSGNVGS